MSWKDLSIPLKAELIRMGVKAGIGLKLLLSLYDELLSIEGVIKEELTIDNNRNVQLQDPSVYMLGLIKEAEDAYRKYSQGINDTIYNPSRDNPPFILRILNNDRRSVKDWLNDGYYSTHKLSYALTPEGFVVYPDVLDINGLLHDFTDPKYDHGKWDALDSAILRGDTLVFPTELKAREYTETYKTLYPEYFNLFNIGGYTNPEGDEVALDGITYQLPPLSLLDLQFIRLANSLGRVPTQAELIQDERSRQANLYSDAVNTGIVSEAKEDNLTNNLFRAYNNFRYSHPWAEGLNWTPIIGDGMDLISLAGDVDNKDYINAGLGLGMLALPNFILKSLLKGKVLKQIPVSYEKRNMLKRIKNKTWDKHFNKALQENNIQEARKIFNLHLKAKTPEGYLNVILYHGSRFGDTPLRIYIKSPTKKTYGFYMTPNKNYAAGYLHPLGGASVIRQVEPSEFTLTYKNIYTFPDYNLGYAINSQLYKNLINLGYDSGITFYKNRIPEYIAFNPNLVKSNNLITYNKSKKVIPLSERHNFKRPDSNYSWVIPTIPFGLMSYKLLNLQNLNQNSLGGYLFPNLAFSHKFEEGGYTNPSTTSTIEDEPKVIKKGTVGWNPFNVFNRNYRGAPIYESDNFGDSFRLARIDKVPIFIWNGEAYNTNLKPNPLVEAARAWDTQGDLRKIEFQKKIIRDPEGTMEYFREKFPKDTYITLNKNWDNDTYIINDMYNNGALGMPDNVIIRGTRYDIGDLLWDYLNTTDLTYNQKLALMANSYKESMGWTTTRQIDGPAKGYYQLEKELFKKYKKWLERKKLKDNIISETKYIIDLFENHRDKLITPISANLDIEDIINNYKDAEEAQANKHRSAYMHRGYYTEDALRDWDEGDLDAAVKAMEALFEKAGKPRIEDRQKIAWLLSEKYK